MWIGCKGVMTVWMGWKEVMTVWMGCKGVMTVWIGWKGVMPVWMGCKGVMSYEKTVVIVGMNRESVVAVDLEEVMASVGIHGSTVPL